MKIVADPEQIRYFKEHRIIQLDDVVPSSRLNEVNDEIDTILSKRTGAKKEVVSQLPPAEVYPYARDLWRDGEVIKKFDCQNRFADLLSNFFVSQKFILGSDQLLAPEFSSSMGYEPYYPQAFLEPKHLEDLGSIQGVHSALIVCLQGESERDNTVFPTCPGSVTVVDPNYAVPFGELATNLSQRFLMITFADPDALYLYHEGDPNTHYWKSQGYVFGDKLMQKGHPPIRL